MDYTQFRYVLYARKSTEDDSRQVRSVPDQIADCKALAQELGLNVVKIVRDKKSAKKPGNRARFTDMLNDISAGKYDAILSWHPDRLCRNMLEGGRIIDMLDNGELKDLKLCSHNFSNDANGKMLLGMLFVFSKQYSDDLSAKVSRGVKGNLREGKSSGAPMHGYIRDDETGYYRPNEWFETIRQAWLKRAEGESLDTILKYLEDEGYYREVKQNKRKIPASVTILSRMFSNSFYYGVLVQAKQDVDLRELYDFTPMIDEETYNKVQAISYNKTRHKKKSESPTFYPLHGMVYCAVCNNEDYMKVGKNLNGSKEYVLSYRCDNPQCTRKPRSLRAKYVLRSLYAILERMDFSDDMYRKYEKKIHSLTDAKIIEIKNQIRSKRGAFTKISNEVKDRSLALGSGNIDKQSKVYQVNTAHIEELAAQQAELDNQIKKLEQKISNPAKIKLSQEEFLNLLKSSADKMRAGSPHEKDALCRILFLNLRVDNEKVASYLWREPFASFLKATEFSSGRGDRT